MLVSKAVKPSSGASSFRAINFLSAEGGSVEMGDNCPEWLWFGRVSDW